MAGGDQKIYTAGEHQRSGEDPVGRIAPRAYSRACGIQSFILILILILTLIPTAVRAPLLGLALQVYHGNRRGDISAEDIESADIVLTTYSILESDYRKFCMPGKVQCRYCGKRFLPDKLRVHLRCGPVSWRGGLSGWDRDQDWDWARVDSNEAS